MAGFAYIRHNRPKRYQVLRCWDASEKTELWTDDLSEAHNTVCRLNDGKRHYTVVDHLGEDGIFERDVAAFRAEGHRAEWDPIYAERKRGIQKDSA